MHLPACETLVLTLESGILHVTLNRPKARNAMNLVMVTELMVVFSGIQSNREIRAVVIRGTEGHFCAGGDIKDMVDARQKLAQGEAGDPFYEMNRKFGQLISLVNSAPQAVVVILEGSVMGGGFGLACVSDIAIAHQDATFKLPETGLGIPPAQIAPFVVQRIGLTQARRLGVMGARFQGAEAKELGVVHYVCENEDAIQQELTDILKRIKRCAPKANALTKKLMLATSNMPLDTLLDEAAKDFSACIQGIEGAEGTKAFIEKRSPSWAEE
ncbi:enoyl-CoA hydratase/isomerase family protein [Deltaproteobacteria bacterium TL4]